MTQLLTVADVARLMSMTEASIRWWIQADVDGFNSMCVVRRARRVFIDPKKFDAWIDIGRTKKAG